MVTTVSSTVTRLNRWPFEPVLMSGNKVRIQKGQTYKYYEVPRFNAPKLMLPVEVDVCQPFPRTLAVMSDTGSQTSISHEATELDVDSPGLAQYRLHAIDKGVLFDVLQPQSASKFTNAAGTLYFHYGTTHMFFKNRLWSMLPEIFTLNDEATPLVKAINMDMNRTKLHARFMAYGYYYPLKELKTHVDPQTQRIVYEDDAGVPRYVQAALTVEVGSKQ